MPIDSDYCKEFIVATFTPPSDYEDCITDDPRYLDTKYWKRHSKSIISGPEGDIFLPVDMLDTEYYHQFQTPTYPCEKRVFVFRLPWEAESTTPATSIRDVAFTIVSKGNEVIAFSITSD